MEEMDREIEVFMLEHPSIFHPDLRPVGKLTAWFNYQKEHCSSNDLTRQMTVLSRRVAAQNNESTFRFGSYNELDLCWASGHLDMAIRAFMREYPHESIPKSGDADADKLMQDIIRVYGSYD